MNYVKPLAVLIILFAFAQHQALSQHTTWVDDDGVIRWTADDAEVFGFGVNYSTPFAHAYRMANRMGVSHEDAIAQDVYHFARLDFNLYRVHVWDTEISDTLGNLVHNEHLRLFDFTIYEMKKRGMKFVITPIAFWGNGWPEPDFDTPGFSRKYGKAACLTDPAAIKAQENYLYQFLSHVNPYTGIAYKEDPDIIAFEVSNEPHHPGTVEEVVDFINRMVAAMRRTGTQIPIFYNMSHSIHLYRAYLEADVQGGTFQWYPTGLVAHRQINGNFLPHVNEYYIPFADDPAFTKMAKLVYEFDAADAEGNYMYPAMARSFRQAGMQVAAHFDYDAMFLAPYNTNYGTHYMTLPYAPQKALSLKIASAVFHEVPRFAQHGPYPENTTFGNFRVDYTQDLAELVSDRRFFYSNHTASTPANPEMLHEIAGYGNSPLVYYDGKGAYFLDKLEEGVWRLELMPDAHWLGDPYARISPQRQVAAVNYRHRTMILKLPQLGDSFSIEGINAGNTYRTTTQTGRFDIIPGVYLLRVEGNRSEIDTERPFKNIVLNEFVAPESNLEVSLVKNNTPAVFTAGQQACIRFEVISPEPPEQVQISAYGEFGVRQIEAVYEGNDIYVATIPDDVTSHGRMHYYIIPEFESGFKTFPAGKPGRPGDWDFYDHSSYSIHFVPSDMPVVLWCAYHDHTESMRPWHPRVAFRPSHRQGAGSLNFLFDEIPNSQDGTGRSRVYAFKYSFRDKISGRRADLAQKEYLVVSGGNNNEKEVTFKIALIDNNGNVFSHPLVLKKGQHLYRIPLNEFSEGRFAIIPRPYPEFKPWYAGVGNHADLIPETLETLQITIKGEHNESVRTGFNVHLREVWLE